MFQYAVAKALARRLGCPFRLHVPLIRIHKDRPFELPCFAARIPLARLPDFRAFTGGVLSWPFLRRRRHPQVRQEQGHYFEASLLRARAPLYLEGYWQSEKYFREYRDELLEDFTFRTAPIGSNLATKKQIEESQSVAIHVRRGDYVSNPGTNAHHGALALPYYEPAIRYLSERVRDPLFFVFSDDIGWAREHLGPLARCVFVDHNKNAGSEDLRLMSACKHQIIANSSFSWWAAWLNKNPSKLVVTPRNWLNKPAHTFEDIYPAGCVRI